MQLRLEFRLYFSSKSFPGKFFSLKYRGVINGKAGKAAALPKFSDLLTLSQSGWADYAQPLALLGLKNYVIKPLNIHF